MSWLKDVIVDLVATAFIIAAVITSNTILSGIVWGYTVLLLFAKLLVFGDSFKSMMNKAKTEAPEWFTHLLYAINTGILLSFQWWYVGACWATIWLSSYFAQRKLDQKEA